MNGFAVGRKSGKVDKAAQDATRTTTDPGWNASDEGGRHVEEELQEVEEWVRCEGQRSEAQAKSRRRRPARASRQREPRLASDP